MQDVKSLALDIVEREGGYVNDPDDPGGATNLGVTLKTLKSVGYRGKFGRDITVHDLRSLTKHDAADIFLRHYFFRPKIDRLHVSIQSVVFDMCVNSGKNAITLLQKSSNLADSILNEDGIIGEKTVRYVFDLIEKKSYPMRDIYSIERRNYYLNLADVRPSLRKFAKSRRGGKGGWITRAEAFLSPKYHLSNQEFQERTSSWD